MKTLVLWRGHHDKTLLTWIDQAWKGTCQLIIIPPLLHDFSFLNLWPGNIQYEGAWPNEVKAKVPSPTTTPIPSTWPTETVLGIFTSGTLSGKPKLVLFTKENLLISLESIRKLYDLNRIQHIFCYPQPTHVFGLILGYLQSYLYHIPLIALEEPYSRETHKLWHQTVNKNTLTLGTPVHFSDLLHWVEKEKMTPSPSYSCIIGGAPVNVSLWKRLQHDLHIEAPSIGYGATEASLGISHLAPGIEPICDSLIGEIFPHIKIHKMDQQGFTFSGPNVAKAILEDNTFKYSPELQISDMLCEKKHKASHYFTFEGRSDLMINRGGLKISPELIESLIDQVLGCQSIALGYPNNRLGYDIALLYEDHKSLDKERALQSLIAENFGFKINPQLLLSGEIPKSDHGKKDRIKALKYVISKIHPQNQPLPTSLLKSFMPHRNAAIWIDSITEFRPHFGRAKLAVKNTAAYWPLNSTESIEWIAQTYGYAQVANEIYGLKKINAVNKTLIAEVKSFENLSPSDWHTIHPGDEIEVIVQCTYDFTPLFILEGEVLKDKKPIAKVNMKVYAGL